MGLPALSTYSPALALITTNEVARAKSESSPANSWRIRDRRISTAEQKEQ